ncbi:hypothetical protein [Paenibacillus peoriae]|nr:hypothetical protein [Paenibacillus peoriae]
MVSDSLGQTVEWDKVRRRVGSARRRLLRWILKGSR